MADSHSAEANSNASPTQPSARKATLSPRVLFVATAVAALFLGADQLSKTYIVNNYLPNQEIAGNTFISLVFVTNPGGICGYAQGAGTLLTVVGAITSAFIAVSIFLVVPDNLVYAAAFGSMFAGALGNLIDRLRFGYVVDFITLDFLSWPSFNLADASIIAGVALVGLLTLVEMGLGEVRAPVRNLEAPAPSRWGIGRNSLLFLVIAGLAFAVAYYFCVFRPFS